MISTIMIPLWSKLNFFFIMFRDNHHVLQNISFIYLMFCDYISIKVGFTIFNIVARVDYKYLMKVTFPSHEM